MVRKKTILVMITFIFVFLFVNGEEKFILEADKYEIINNGKDTAVIKCYSINGNKKKESQQFRIYAGEREIKGKLSTTIAGIYAVAGKNGKVVTNVIKIKSVPAEKQLLKRYVLKDETGEKKLETVYEYDNKGNAVRSLNKNSEGIIIEKNTEYSYDIKGNILKSTFKDKDGKITAENEYVYDSNGNITRFTQKNKDGMITGETEWEYQYSGKIKRSEIKKVKDKTGAITGVKETAFDDKGIKLSEKQTIKDKKGNNVMENITYFEAERKVKEESRNKEGTIVKTVNFIYDQNEEMLSETSVNKDGKIINTKEYKIEYGLNNLKKKQIMTSKDENGTIISTNTSFFDNVGNMTGYVLADQEGLVTEQGEIVYDRNGNIVKETSKDQFGKIISTAESEY